MCAQTKPNQIKIDSNSMHLLNLLINWKIVMHWAIGSHFVCDHYTCTRNICWGLEMHLISIVLHEIEQGRRPSR